MRILNTTTHTVLPGMLCMLSVGAALIQAAVYDDFEDGAVNAAKWTYQMYGSGVDGMRDTSWQRACTEDAAGSGDGHLDLRVWGPDSANTYGAEGCIRTTQNFNDGNHWVIDWTWSTIVNYEAHVDIFAVLLAYGDMPASPDLYRVPGRDVAYMQSYDDFETFWATYVNFGVPPPQPSGNFGPVTWSLDIDPAGTASLYLNGTRSGAPYRTIQLDKTKPWHLAFLLADGTSVGYAQGDNTLRLYNVNASNATAPGDCSWFNPASTFGILTSQPSSDHYGFDFDGRFVVWRDNRVSGSENQEIYAYDLRTQTEIQVSHGPPGQKHACRVSDGVVVWARQISGYHCELWGKDLTGRLWPSTEPPRMLKDIPGFSEVDVDRDWVVTSENHFGGNTADLYAQNLRTGESFPIPGPAMEWYARISGSLVVYGSTPRIWEWEGPRDWDVYGFDLRSRAPFPISVGPGNFQGSALSESQILLFEVPFYTPTTGRNAWLLDLPTQRMRLLAAGCGDAAVSGDLCIYNDYFDTGSPAPKVLNLTTGVRCQISPYPGGDFRFVNNIAVWRDGRSPATSGRYFIYGHRFGTPPPPPPPTPDADCDGVPDKDDQCPNTPLLAVVNDHGCSINQLVPASGPATGGTWKNHGEYMASLTKVVQDFFDAGLITPAQKGQIISKAAKSKAAK